MRFTLLLCASLFACGGGAAKSADEPAAPADTAAPAAAAVNDEPKVSDEAAKTTPVDQAVALYEQLVQVVTKSSDCDQMAADVSAWADSTADQRKAINDHLNENEADMQEVQRRVGERPELMQQIQQAVEPCKDNPALMEAFMKAQGA